MVFIVHSYKHQIHRSIHNFEVNREQSNGKGSEIQPDSAFYDDGQGKVFGLLTMESGTDKTLSLCARYFTTQTLKLNTSDGVNQSGFGICGIRTY